MGWPYQLVNLTEDEKNLRRELLDRYGTYAQISALVPVFAFQLYRLAVWVSTERSKVRPGYSAVPGSPAIKKLKSMPRGLFSKRWRSFVWWLEGDIAPEWGLRMHWIAGLAWALWLLFLSVHQTGVDYLHVTKRFGAVAASQFPVHYMLSMKGHYSPMAIAFRASHEELNPWHRISGRIIYAFLVLHATWYLNFFIQAGVLYIRMTSLVPLLGVAAFCLFTILASTAISRVRRWSYRVFFIVHLTVGVVTLPILCFHAFPLRLYTAESLALFFIDLIARKVDTIKTFATFTPIEGSNILKLTFPIPSFKSKRFITTPGQHVYLSLPHESTPNGTPILSLYSILHNPFTVAEATPNEVSLVFRTLNGPMTRSLRSLTKLSKARPPIRLEGPYGASQRFPNLVTDFDRVLLVAGGVGASFILPIYRHLAAVVTEEGFGSTKLEMIWTMRSIAEAAWTKNSQGIALLENDDRVKIYLTNEPEASPWLEQDGVEMDTLAKDEEQTLLAGSVNARPDLKEIVDKIFRHGEYERIAVLVCGPAGMAEQLREHVGRWVSKGRYVWYHNEAFGW